MLPVSLTSKIALSKYFAGAFIGCEVLSHQENVQLGGKSCKQTMFASLANGGFEWKVNVWGLHLSACLALKVLHLCQRGKHAAWKHLLVSCLLAASSFFVIILLILSAPVSHLLIFTSPAPAVKFPSVLPSFKSLTLSIQSETTGRWSRDGLLPTWQNTSVGWMRVCVSLCVYAWVTSPVACGSTSEQERGAVMLFSERREIDIFTGCCSTYLHPFIHLI